MSDWFRLDAVDPGAWLLSGAAIAIFAAGGWLVSLRRNDVSIVDAMWSLMFLLALLVYLVADGATGWHAWLVTALVAAWALRLSGYIAWRSHGEPEDRRYREIRRNHQPNFRFKSLYIVFGLQGLLAWVIVLPVLAAVNGQASPGPLYVVAVGLWLTGMFFEVVGDAQLARFKADPANEGQVLDSGLWRYTRHPNYFGECLIWWAYYLLAVPAGGAWTVFAPILMTFLLLRVSGVSLLEKDITERRPAYRRYKETTNAFIPGPPKSRGPGAAAAALVLAAMLPFAGPLRAEITGDLQPAEIDREWAFRVFVDDKEVGHHHFRLAERDDDDERVLESVADFEYKLLFVPVYSYEHQNREVWDGDCLSRIESQTDANGKGYAIEGERQDDAFVVEGATGTQRLPECVMSFAYWNPDFLHAPRLLNAQNGEYLEVEVTGPERAERVASGESRLAWRYRLQAKKLDLKLWYSDDREWLGLETTYENGRTLRYELLTEPQVAAQDAGDPLPGVDSAEAAAAVTAQ